MSQLGTYNFMSVETITGNVGGKVFPQASNINILGAGGLLVTGVPATSTLTITGPGGAGGGFVTSFTVDVGGPIGPTVLGRVDLNGGNNIATDGTVPNIVTFNLTGTTDHAVQVGNATASITSLAVGATGTVLIGTTGADPSFSATVLATTFDTNVVAAAVTLTAITLAADGTDLNIPINITPKGTGNLVVATGIAASTGDITATLGNIVSTAGQVNAGTTMTAGTGITATLGNIVSTAGQVNAGTTMTAGTGITATTGNVVATIGQVNAGTTMTAGTGITATIGNITATAGNVAITLGNLTIPATIAAGTSGVITFGGVKFINNMGATNTFIGGNAGNLGLTVGTTLNNTSIGFNSMLAIDAGVNNTSCGGGGLMTLMAGNRNTTLGKDAGDQITTGSDNICIGFDAGHGITGVHDSNIIIGHVGAAEDHTIRIGTHGGNPGEQNIAYLAGIYGSSSAAATTSLVTVDSVGKLGATALATNGQLLIGSTGAAPVWAVPASAGGTIGITTGAGTLNLEVISAMPWTEEAGPALALVAGHGYVLNGGALITATLPIVAAARTIITLVGMGVGLYTIAQNAVPAQVIHFDDVDTTVGIGGSLTATNRYDCIELICIVANTEWVVRSSVGNFTIV